MQKTFTGFSRKNIRGIHKLSSKLNEIKHKAHEQVLLDLMGEHAEEIKQLYELENAHYLVETGDLLILCLELLEAAQENPDIIMEKCYKRYNEKLSGLISEFKKQKGKKNG
ncbi:MAG: hypothetical protein KAS13_09305 [Candidatus Omnitrophica bacterium]|nr:hypothetical protein [Candidatus Omnitrophota bacterium]